MGCRRDLCRRFTCQKGSTCVADDPTNEQSHGMTLGFLVCIWYAHERKVGAEGALNQSSSAASTEIPGSLSPLLCRHVPC